jgi:hypothetical protein
MRTAEAAAGHRAVADTVPARAVASADVPFNVAQKEVVVSEPAPSAAPPSGGSLPVVTLLRDTSARGGKVGHGSHWSYTTLTTVTVATMRILMCLLTAAATAAMIRGPPGCLPTENLCRSLLGLSFRELGTCCTAHFGRAVPSCQRAELRFRRTRGSSHTQMND